MMEYRDLQRDDRESKDQVRGRFYYGMLSNGVPPQVASLFSNAFIFSKRRPLVRKLRDSIKGYFLGQGLKVLNVGEIDSSSELPEGVDRNGIDSFIAKTSSPNYVVITRENKFFGSKEEYAFVIKTNSKGKKAIAHKRLGLEAKV